jgi:hypothetical protein
LDAAETFAKRHLGGLVAAGLQRRFHDLLGSRLAGVTAFDGGVLMEFAGKGRIPPLAGYEAKFNQCLFHRRISVASLQFRRGFVHGFNSYDVDLWRWIGWGQV